MTKRDLKIAIAHDWLVTYAGAETVLENILKLFDKLDLFCIIKDSKILFLNAQALTGFVQVPYKEFLL